MSVDDPVILAALARGLIGLSISSVVAEVATAPGTDSPDETSCGMYTNITFVDNSKQIRSTREFL
jgi:hypothetical protein